MDLLLAQAAITPDTTISLGWVVASIGGIATIAGIAAVGLYKANKADATCGVLSNQVATLKAEMAALKSEHAHVVTALGDLKIDLKDLKREMGQKLTEITSLLLDRASK